MAVKDPLREELVDVFQHTHIECITHLTYFFDHERTPFWIRNRSGRGKNVTPYIRFLWEKRLGHEEEYTEQFVME